MNLDYHIDDINDAAEALIRRLTSKTVLFYGDMGTGKTTLIKALVKNLGSSDDVSSPTFSIVNEYEAGNNKIVHFDLYRIKDKMELMDIGFEEYVNSDDWVFIEWPELAIDLLPDHYEILSVHLKNKHSRTLKLSSNNHKTLKEAIKEH